MGNTNLEESSLFLDEILLQLMEQLQLLDDKRGALNSLTEQVCYRLIRELGCQIR